jgi:Tol biopolymer transport system component
MVPKLSHSIWRVDLRDPGRKPGTPFKLILSTRNDLWPTYSPDGKRIAFSSDRSGKPEVWVCDSDGSNPVQLTSFREGEAHGPKWSPDGTSIVFAGFVGQNRDLYVIGTNGGAARRLTTDPADDTWPCWSRDGQWIYFRSPRSGESEIWKMPAAGGDAVQITRNGGDVPQASPDGRSLYYLKGDPYPTSCSVWRTPVGGGEETKVLDSVHCGGLWAVAGQGIYFFAEPDEKGQSDIRFYEFATGRISKILTIVQDVAPWIAVSPDGRTILYTEIETGSDLMLVENFR